MYQVIYKNQKTGQTIYLTPMVHIAESKFYQEVKEDLDRFNQNHPNGLILFEQVAPKEFNQETLSKNSLLDRFMGNLFLFKNFSLSKLYKHIADLIQLEAQSNVKLFLKRNEDFEQYAEEKDFSKVPILDNAKNIDVNLEYIEGILYSSGYYELSEEFFNYFLKKEKDELKNNKNAWQKVKLFFKKHFCFLNQIDDFEKSFEEIKNKWLFKSLIKLAIFLQLNKKAPVNAINFIMNGKNTVNKSDAEDFSIDKFNQENPIKDDKYYKKLRNHLITAFKNIILYKRNQYLMSYIKNHITQEANSHYEDLYIVYGAMHFSPNLPKEYNIQTFLEENGFSKVCE